MISVAFEARKPLPLTNALLDPPQTAVTAALVWKTIFPRPESKTLFPVMVPSNLFVRHHRHHVLAREVRRLPSTYDPAKPPLELMQPFELQVPDKHRQESPDDGCPLLPEEESPKASLTAMLPMDAYASGEDNHESRVMRLAMIRDPNFLSDGYLSEVNAPPRSESPISLDPSWDIVTEVSQKDAPRPMSLASVPSTSVVADIEALEHTQVSPSGMSILPSTETPPDALSIPSGSTISALSVGSRTASERFPSLDRNLREVGFHGLRESSKRRYVGGGC